MRYKRKGVRDGRPFQLLDKHWKALQARSIVGSSLAGEGGLPKGKSGRPRTAALGVDRSAHPNARSEVRVSRPGPAPAGRPDALAGGAVHQRPPHGIRRPATAGARGHRAEQPGTIRPAAAGSRCALIVAHDNESTVIQSLSPSPWWGGHEQGCRTRRSPFAAPSDPGDDPPWSARTDHDARGLAAKARPADRETWCTFTL
jgi:hypothetical protein